MAACDLLFEAKSWTLSKFRIKQRVCTILILNFDLTLWSFQNKTGLWGFMALETRTFSKLEVVSL